MPYYDQSTMEAVADLSLGLHVETTGGVLVAANFTIAAQTELFNTYGRIAVKQLFIELTAAADANATLVAFNYTGVTPTVALNAMTIASATIASIGIFGRITFVAGGVGVAPVVTDSAGLTDVETAGLICILGGISATGVLQIGTIGMVATVATQAATIAATAHLFYKPMCKGAYCDAII